MTTNKQQSSDTQVTDKTEETTDVSTQQLAQDNAKNLKIRKVTNIILLVVFGIFIFHLIADRFIPITDLGRVRGFIVPITPQVSGEIIKISVSPNTPVKKGDVLAQINPIDYEIALQTAEQNVTKAGQNMGALTANVNASEAKVTNAQANLKNAQVQSKRIFAMVKKGVMSEADADNARRRHAV